MWKVIMNIIYAFTGWIISTFGGGLAKDPPAEQLLKAKLAEAESDLIEAELQQRQWAAKAAGLRESLTYLRTVKSNASVGR